MEKTKKSKRTYDGDYSEQRGSDKYDDYEEDEEKEIGNAYVDPVAVPEEVEEEEQEEEVQIDYTNKVIVENITYIPVPGIKKKKYKFLDHSMILDIPDNLVELRNTKPRKEYEDAIETFVYNVVSKKSRFQVAHCQIFLCDKD